MYVCELLENKQGERQGRTNKAKEMNRFLKQMLNRNRCVHVPSGPSDDEPVRPCKKEKTRRWQMGLRSKFDRRHSILVLQRRFCELMTQSRDRYA